MTQIACLNDHLTRQMARIQKHKNAAALALTHLDEADARIQANRVDQTRQSGPLAGLTCAIKACFDVKGWITHAGSAALLDASPATDDAALVSTLREQGAIILAQTNMTEFAYGALGLNAHFGTPRTPLLADGEHVAGGSSSGAAVSVALGFVDVALCTDTSGSARIPAAFCGVVGMIPTRGCLDMSGVLGLSPSFDVPGIMTTSVSGCRRVFEALVDNAQPRAPKLDAPRRRSDSLSLCVPEWVFGVEADPEILALFCSAIEFLRSQGVKVVRREIAALQGLGTIAAEGGIIAADAYALHQDLLARRGAYYEPLVRRRIEAGAETLAWKYGKALRALAARAVQYEEQLQDFDAVLTPTCPIFPPRLSALLDETCYLTLNRQSFVFTEIANRLGKPSISLPLGRVSDKPAALLLTGKTGLDTQLFALASQLESSLHTGNNEGVINDRNHGARLAGHSAGS